METAIDVEVSANVDVSQLLLNILSNFAGLYQDQWFLASIIVAFFFGQLAHAILRGFFPQWRDLVKALIIWTVQLVVGYSATFKLMDGSFDVEKYAWLTGINSIAIYYILLWVSTRWFKMPRLAQFLSLRETKVSDSGEVDFGATIKFLRNKEKE